MLCRHCRCRRVNRPRRLCWLCYARLDVRSRFKPICKFTQHGVADYCGKSRPSATPTRALPGTPEKVIVLAERASLRQELWHPLDARWEDPAAAV